MINFNSFIYTEIIQESEEKVFFVQCQKENLPQSKLVKVVNIILAQKTPEKCVELEV